MRTLVFIKICFVVGTMSASTALADGAGLEKSSHSVNVEADNQFAVHKSNTIAGTDFGQTLHFGVSAYAGKEKEFGLGLRHDQSSTRFTQKDSKMQVQWTDFALSYRLWWFSPMLMVGSCAVSAEAVGVELIDAVCLTSGAGLKGQLPIGATAVTYFESVFVTPSSARDLEGRKIKIGMRSDSDAGIAIRFFQMLDLITGYRYRTYSLSIDGTKETEIQTGPYLGVRLGASL